MDKRKKVAILIEIKCPIEKTIWGKPTLIGGTFQFLVDKNFPHTLDEENIKLICSHLENHLLVKMREKS